MPPKTPVSIRKIGGPPRSTTKPSASTSNTASAKGKAPIRPNQQVDIEDGDTDTEDAPVVDGNAAAEGSGTAAGGGRRVKLRPDPSYISQLEMQDDQEDSDEGGWDEVGASNPSGGVTNDYSSPTPSANAGPSRQRNLTDDETTGGARTATATEDEGTAEEEEVDLEAVYGYDFRAELDNADRAGVEGKVKGKARAGVEISLGPMDGLTEEQRQRAEELANRKWVAKVHLRIMGLSWKLIEVIA